MARVDLLIDAYQRHISAPWQKNLTGAERTIFLVYPKADERKLLHRLPSLEAKTLEAGRGWLAFSFHRVFSDWFHSLHPEQREVYLEEPDALSMALDPDHETPFSRFASERLLELFEKPEADGNTVVALVGAASLYGFSRLSTILDAVRHAQRGQLLILFPGSFDGSHYRLLDARDGANYLATTISANTPAHP
jgi:hypothetical protein